MAQMFAAGASRLQAVHAGMLAVPPWVFELVKKQKTLWNWMFPSASRKPWLILSFSLLL